MSGAGADRAERPISFAAPFRHSAFTVLWTATLVSNVGGWMYSAASGWLMTSLNPDALMVALVQAASSLPICLFSMTVPAWQAVVTYLVPKDDLPPAIAANSVGVIFHAQSVRRSAA